MQVQERVLSKAERQRLVGSLITRRRVGTQMELLEQLARAGCRVTQATVSRDIRELGLEKTHDPLGRPRYTIPQPRSRPDPDAALSAVLEQFGRDATAAENIVVVHSELGSAPAVARAIDRIEHALIVGTLAGDDTCLVIARNAADARTLAREIRARLG
jgi:transcriptional regulator of arginine metabolism